MNLRFVNSGMQMSPVGYGAKKVNVSFGLKQSLVFSLFKKSGEEVLKSCTDYDA